MKNSMMKKIALTVAAVLIGTVLLPAAVFADDNAQQECSLKITAGSVLNGKAEEANEFSFSLCENGNVLETVGNGPAAEWIIGQPKTEDMIGTVDFTALTYTKENIGEHVYTVSETADTEKYSTNKATFTITVLVLDTENGLQTVVTSVKAQHGTNEKDLECLDLTASNLLFGNVLKQIGTAYTRDDSSEKAADTTASGSTAAPAASVNQETAAATVESPEAAGAAAAAEETETAVTGTDAEETAAEDTKAEDTASAEAENDDAVVAETANQASEEVTEAADNEENVQAVSGAEAPAVRTAAETQAAEDVNTETADTAAAEDKNTVQETSVQETAVAENTGITETVNTETKVSNAATAVKTGTAVTKTAAYAPSASTGSSSSVQSNTVYIIIVAAGLLAIAAVIITRKKSA